MTGMRLTKNTDLDSVAERIGAGDAAALRASKSRREPHLQKFAQLLSEMFDINLDLNPDIAAANMEIGRQIYIPSSEFKQPVTDIPERVYDMLAQETLTTHEVGHLLYSDWPSLKSQIDEIEQQVTEDDEMDDNPEDWSSVYKDLWNAAEDGAIEAELSKAFLTANEFEILNANLSEAATIGTLMPDEQVGGEVYNYDMVSAMIQAFLDLSVYDSGRLDQLLDDSESLHTLSTQEETERFREAIPEIERTVQAMHNEPDGESRNKLFYSWWQECGMDILQNSQISGVENNNGEDNLGHGRSDDAHPGIGDAEEEMQHTGEGSIPGDRDEEGDDAAASGDGDEEEPENDGDEPGRGQREDDATEKYDELLRQEARDAVGDSTMDEIEAFHQILQGSPADIDGITIPESVSVNQETRQIARRTARNIKPILENQLRESRFNQVDRGRASGTLDTRSMIDAQRGSVRVFQRDQEGDKKDYSFVLVIDRSGSMRYDIDNVEIATGAFLYALEELGVDTMCLDICAKTVRLAKPFGSPVEEHTGTLFTGQYGGGTPLTEALHFARRRVEEGRGSRPAIMVITDGGAADAKRYRSELQQCNVPVIGMYLLPSNEQLDQVDTSEREQFHRFRAIGSQETVTTALQQLSREVLL